MDRLNTPSINGKGIGNTVQHPKPFMENKR